jgi:hypothetical protein
LPLLNTKEKLFTLFAPSVEPADVAETLTLEGRREAFGRLSMNTVGSISTRGGVPAKSCIAAGSGLVFGSAFFSRRCSGVQYAERRHGKLRGLLRFREVLSEFEPVGNATVQRHVAKQTRAA